MTERKLVVHCKRDPYDVLIDRTTIWGNPFSHKPGTRAKYLVSTREEAIAKFEEWLLARPQMVALAKRELRGLVLGCWCRPSEGFRGRLLCHGQILAAHANDLDPSVFE